MKPSLQKVVLALALVGVLSPCVARAEEGEAKARFVTPVSLELTKFLRYPNNDWFDVYGLRLGIWIAEDRMTDVSGVSIGLLAINNDEVKGIQLAGLFNNAREISGIQLGAFNDASSVYGVQVGLINNFNLLLPCYTEFYGVQIGAINLVHTIRGVQAGILNEADGRVSGLQLGIFNSASSLKGVQIGLFNGDTDGISSPLLRVGW